MTKDEIQAACFAAEESNVMLPVHDVLSLLDEISAAGMDHGRRRRAQERGMTEMRANGNTPASYEEAFYDICKLLDVPAMPISPMQAYCDGVRPKIVSLIEHAEREVGVMSIDMEAMRLEEAMWVPTPRLRWFRPERGTEADLVLQQLYERVTGERDWRELPTCCAD